jgi:tyrosyl-tRNA synthetase
VHSRNVYQELTDRGFIQQVTEPEKLQALLEAGPVTYYVGIDPTADSLHVGHLMAIMGMVQMQRFGHRPIAIIGSGTAMVGDPTGKTEMRKMLTREQIVANSQKIKTQLARYLDFSEGKALMVDNYDWLGTLNYIDFLRDIGRYFSVNRMLTYEAYKVRLERGLSFIEFNYQLLQAYDFLMLYKKYGCRLQMGGDDQWANILAGIDLIRRIEEQEAFCLTFPLLTTATGQKMGKTESGAVWLDAEKFSPYEYYQFWVNADDRDVAKFLSFFTVLAIEEIEPVKNLQGAELNAAKTVLAYEATKLTHGEEAAQEALRSSRAAFGRRIIPADLLPSSTIPRASLQSEQSDIPGTDFSKAELAKSPRLLEVLEQLKLVDSKSEARRLIQQGGLHMNQERVTDIACVLGPQHVCEGRILFRLGKKKYHQLHIVP